MRVVIEHSETKKYMAACGQVRDQITSSNQNMKSIRLVESNIAFAETTVSGGYDRFYIRSTESPERDGSTRNVHRRYRDSRCTTVRAHDTSIRSRCDCDVCGRSPQFESGNDFTIDDTDVNATDSMGRSVTSGSSDSATVVGLDDVVYSTFNGTVFEATAPYDVYTGKERYLFISGSRGRPSFKCSRRGTCIVP
jgi:hypothetical protein